MFIKQILYRLLGVKNYLTVVSKLFFVSYRMGWLKKNPTFDCHYFVKNLIQKGDHVIDIGANLGYYSRIFAQRVQHKGRVHSVEPVGLFREILKKNLSGFSQATIIPYALGDRDDQSIVMGIPKSNKYLRHGLTHVLEEGEMEEMEFQFEEKMFTPQTIFGSFNRCDYLKCDVEGYEMHIIPRMAFLFERCQPLVQIEIEPQNRNFICQFFENLNYQAFSLTGVKLHRVTGDPIQVYGDFFFVPDQKIESIKHLIA